MKTKFVISENVNCEKVQEILDEFAKNSKNRIPCCLAIDGAHPSKQMVFKFLRETDLPCLKSQVTLNGWIEWSTNHHHL